jgi:hypothetical protein
MIPSTSKTAVPTSFYTFRSKVEASVREKLSKERRWKENTLMEIPFFARNGRIHL